MKCQRARTSTDLSRMRRLVGKCTFAERSELPSLYQSLLNREGPISIGFLNQHGYNLAREDEGIFSSFDSLDFLFRDGAGLALACRAFGVDPKANLNGTDLIPSLIEYASASLGDRIQYFAYGTSQPWLDRGADALFGKNRYERLDGFLAADDYVEHFRVHQRAGGHAVVVLGMGMPKQELVSQAIARSACGPALLICGGAILDFKAGRFSRAPRAMRALRVEWLYRLMLEPRRLFSRYVLGIPAFLISVLLDSRFKQPR